MKCPKCRAENRKDAAFCTQCGKVMPQSRRNARPEKIGVGMKILMGVFGMAAIALAIGMAQESNSKSSSINAQPAAFSLAVQALASKFLCACGSCDVPELADCTCPTAIEEKGMIDRELKRGTPEQEVVARLNDRYGHLKEKN